MGTAIGCEYINLVTIPPDANIIIGDDGLNPLFFADKLHKKPSIKNPIQMTTKQWLDRIESIHRGNDSYY